MYGHMDKQPPLTDAWASGLGPYTPVIKDGKLYGRGGADGTSFSCITVASGAQIFAESFNGVRTHDAVSDRNLQDSSIFN